ncbi:FAD/NAD(P)-binding protein [Nocardia aurantiaca]|uniref:Oxidoreductase n=1 Tax=Nocardia aurantiaca TaxID=2675850 RepID=A0A6I3KYQ4_9NOCA|nr:FAD/NAD(P)-binding protein [Nocardia aurantiaca]MTE15212.1 oxidoreductase [Nocardia aurantiaca]
MSSAQPTHAGTNPDTMLRYRVVQRIPQTSDTVTQVLAPIDSAAQRFRAGQFMMLYRFGVGDIALSISGNPCAADDLLEHTIRSVGAVSAALHDAPVGAAMGVRGPFGTGWDLDSVVDRDLIIVGGGVGLAPLRPLILEVLARRTEYRRVVVITGARTPDDILFRHDQSSWRTGGAIELHQTVDHPAPGWKGRIGFVTEPLAKLVIDPARTTAFLCGPEPMMRFCAQTLLGKGMPPNDIRISLERNMQCGVARCGHCQLGPLLVCRDGPIVDYAVAGPLISAREL